MTTRKYTSRSQQTTLTGSVTSGATIIPVVSATTLLGGATISTGQTFTVVIDPDTALEEVVDVTVVSGNNLTITRAIDGSSAQDHSAGAVVRHMIIGRDLREANTHIESSNGVHGLATTSAVVGTLDTQTLYNKTLISPVLTSTLENDSGITFEGTTADSYKTFLTVVDPTQSNTVSLPNTSGTLTINDATQTLTNKTLTSPIISGTPVITGLSSAGMLATSATPKNYVDSILGSATAASTSAASAATSAASAATSANSAATSATSAANSASAAATSASSALTSQTAASTSATSAAASATAAATSATSAAASATAAATSATSAAASATTAAASVATIASYATTASNSAAAAATSAASAAASTSAAATSATSAAASATAAATSATNAAASATAAATSATSASASATTASNSASSALTSATNAANSATTASNSASAAATSATSAAASATAAAGSASAAATSAASAATSATSAATSATSAATTYTAYDQRYLGSKSTAPTLDNQGNALITGATYWNSTTNTMYAWSGSTWSAISSTSAVTNVFGTAGRVSSTGGTTPTLDLVTTAVTAGSYTNASLTVDSYGRLTAASNGTAPVTSVSGTAGQITVTGTTTPTLALATTAVTPGSYPYGTFTVDAYGRITAASTPTSPVTSVTSASTSRISIGGTTTAPTVDLVTTAVTAGTYTAASITVDAYGRLTSATATSPYSAPTLGSTSIGSGATVTTITGLTENNLTLSGTLTAGASSGVSGQVLTSTGSGVQWQTASAGATISDIFLLMGAI